MPMLDSTPDFSASAPLRFPQLAAQPDPESPGALDVMAAAERSSNIVGQAYDRFVNHPRPNAPFVPGFNPVDHVPAGYMKDYGDRFLSAQNPEEIQWIKQRIDDEKTDQGILARAGGWGTAASMAAGQTDPLTLATMALVPEAAPTRLGNALRWAAMNAATTGAQELLAGSMSETRSVGDSALNVGAGAVLGGVLGALAKRVPAAELEGLRAKLEPELRPEDAAKAPEDVLGPNRPSILQEVTGQSFVNPNEGSTTGAAAADTASLENLTTAKGGQFLSQTVGAVAPAARTMGQPSVEARKLTAELVDIPGTLEQNYKGIANPNPIERILWGYDGTHIQGMTARREAFGEYVQRIQKEGGTPISRREFMDGVSAAMRRGDQHEIPEVAKAAQQTRKIVFQPLYDRAVKLGLVPEDAKLYADSYLTRQYDVQKIRGNQGAWINTLRDGFIEQGVDRAEATDIAYKATRNVLGSERGMMDWHALVNEDGTPIVPKSGNMKERTLSLPDAKLEPYLNNDIDHLSHSYLRSMAPEVEMTERFGSRDLKDQIGSIQDEYTRMIERARAAGDMKQMAKLQTMQEKTVADISAMRDRLYGTFGAPKDPGNFFVRAGRLMRQGNAGRLLGAATLAHFPDLGNVMMRYGMPNTFDAMARLATSMEASKLSLKEANRMGAAIDMVMNVSSSLLGDYGNHSRFAEQRIANNLTRTFTIATGEVPLITAVQAMTSTLAQDEMIRLGEKIVAGKRVPANTLAKLAAAGIDQPMLERIADQHGKFGKEVNGLKFGMSDTWKDQAAAKAFESAVLREAHGVTLRPGVGDTPLMMSSEIGKVVLQFKSFAFAASRHVALPIAQGIAHGDARSAAGLFALAGMGTLSYIAKQKAAGQPLETNPARLALEVADKSNLMGWTSEMIYPGLWLAGFKDLSRWSDRDPVETIGGPSAGTLASTFERRFPARLAPAGMTTEDLPFRRSDLHFLRRMMPAQNLWYARRGVNYLEDRIGDLFNLPGESNEQRADQLAMAQEAR